MKRYQQAAIMADLNKKMVFLTGPRQAGKTTLAKTIGKQFKSVAYLNYDSANDRRIIKEEAWLPSTELLIFDEIHKMPDWKNYLKGVYDTKPNNQKLLVIGSASLEVFQHTGDSLAGRYFLHRLMPLSPAELHKMGQPCDLDHFIERSGFPEPFLSESAVDAKRWRLHYADSLLQADVLDFSIIRNLNAIRLVFELLRSRVGSPISYSSIAQDASIAPNTVKNYIAILEALYIIFRVTPFSRSIARSLLKEPKFYFFDTGLVKGDKGIKFENAMAFCLFKHVLAQIDYQAEAYSLHYLRTKEKKEVDFALVKEGEIKQLIEAKYANPRVSKHLLYFHTKYNQPATQVVKTLKQPYLHHDIEVLDGERFLQSLSL